MKSMRKLDTRKLLGSLARLIEKPELKALQFSLIKTLGEIIAARAISLYEIRALKMAETDSAEVFLIPVGYEDHLDAEPVPPMPLSQHPEFEACLESKALIIDSIGIPAEPMFRSIHPIWGPRAISGFLVIESAQCLSRDQDLTTSLLGLYNNFVLLLNDNQHDHLTGLLNRKSFDEKIMSMVLSLGENNKRRSEKIQYCLAVLDIDHFKRVNDTYGHLMGDEVLLHFAQCMTETFREHDLLFRVGGEEFVVVLPNVDTDCATGVLERFRRVIETHRFPQVGQITVSIGVTYIGAADLPVTIMDRADKALYYIKENGRNQVQFFEYLVATGKLQIQVAESDVELF
jgi:diguanylate cyclase (GGDEF)-like protein